MTGRILPGIEAGFPGVTLVSPDARLATTFAPSLNMLGTSLVHDGEELLHLRAGIEAYAERAKTCGIPLLHPWANRLSSDRYEAAGRTVALGRGGREPSRDANGLPNHGLLGGRTEWTIAGEHAGPAETVIVARFEFAAADLLASFPFPHRLEMRVTLSDSGLTVTTSLEATTDQPVPISFGFHPYLRLPGVAREHWTATLPVRTRLLLDERSIPTGRTEPVHIETAALEDRTYDDGFTDIAEPRVFSLSGGGRRVEVELDGGYPYVQLYAPAGSDFFCIEPMTAPANALVTGNGLRLATPGAPFEASFRIRVARLLA